MKEKGSIRQGPRNFLRKLLKSLSLAPLTARHGSQVAYEEKEKPSVANKHLVNFFCVRYTKRKKPVQGRNKRNAQKNFTTCLLLYERRPQNEGAEREVEASALNLYSLERKKEMLQWDFNKKVGELKFRNYAKRESTLNLYQGNALLIACWENKKKYQLMWFFGDKQHMERCLGLEKNAVEKFDNIFSEEPWEMLTFNEKMNNKDMITVIKAVLKAFPYCKIHIESNAMHREEGSKDEENQSIM